ncbi:hypothetical protein V6N12_062450 [Hibiscus sabdariffa]|uniref:Zinc knuckle CX2CX4HX4C domain-containing protein n=1 Tax=Hibiscus sabdariffa TaxID=183260 RepID=A0ABR2F8Z0_9ROSI
MNGNPRETLIPLLYEGPGGHPPKGLPHVASSFILKRVVLPTISFRHHDNDKGMDVIDGHVVMNIISKRNDMHGIWRVVKVDYTTQASEKGKFSCLFVMVDLNKPLFPCIGIDGMIQKLEYEGLHQICYGCRVYGHSNESCGLFSQNIVIPPANGSEQNVMKQMDLGFCGQPFTWNMGLVSTVRLVKLSNFLVDLEKRLSEELVVVLEQEGSF